MKNLKPIIFAFILSGTLFSCSSRNIGLFNTTNPRQAVKENTQDNSAPKNMTASTHSNIAAEPGVKFSYAKLSTPEIKISKNKTNPASPKRELSENVLDAPAKISKEEKSAIKNYIKESLKQNKNKETGLSKGILVIIAILLPPVAVALVDGITGPFWLSILLTLLFYLPGLIYALFRIFRTQ